MRPFPFLKLEPPSDEDMQQAVAIGHEVVAISPLNDEHRMFLKLLCHNGEQTVVWLDAFMVDHLLRHFEAVLAGAQHASADSMRTKFLKSAVGSFGVVPRSHR